MDAAPGCWGGTLARMPAAASVNMDREYAHVQVECGPQNDHCIAAVMTISARVHRSIGPLYLHMLCYSAGQPHLREHHRGGYLDAGGAGRTGRGQRGQVQGGIKGNRWGQGLFPQNVLTMPPLPPPLRCTMCSTSRLPDGLAAPATSPRWGLGGPRIDLDLADMDPDLDMEAPATQPRWEGIWLERSGSGSGYGGFGYMITLAGQLELGWIYLRSHPSPHAALLSAGHY